VATLIILATQEAETWRIAIRSQPKQIVHETLAQKPHHEVMAQGEGPWFKPQYRKINK
jgi:hypothetical protein